MKTIDLIPNGKKFILKYFSIAVIILLCTFTSSAYSQDGCDNGNFEFGIGNFTYWAGAQGSNSGIANMINGTTVFTAATLPYGSYSGGPTNAVNGINPTGTDPIIPGITTTHLMSPNAVRIGNQISGNGADLLSKSFMVDANTSNFSFWYALILQDPGHPYNDQPYFIVRVRNSANVIIPNLGLTLVADATNPFFETVQGIVYKNWDCYNIDLSPYAGQNVTVEFITGDCNFGAHWGYAYIDDICLSCNGSPTGDCSLDTLQNKCGNLPMQICGDFTLPQPPSPLTSNLGSINFEIYQNGVQVGTTISNPAISGNSFCYTLNSNSFPILPPDGFDFVATANFNILNANGIVVSTVSKSSGTPGNGITPGMNNDYNVLCDIDTNCISLVSDTTYCDSLGNYFYEFVVHNNSPTKTVEQLEITVDSPKPPNYVVTMPSTLNVTIPPSGTSETQRVKLVGPGAIARAEVCYTLSAQYLHDDCPWCCYIESCIKLPDCGACVEIISDSLYCSNNNYFYNFLLENGTIYNVTKIQLTSPGADPVTFVPQIIHFATPIAPGEAFPSETVQIIGGYAGLTVPIRIKLFSDDFECCYIELSHTFPACDTLKSGINGNDLNIEEYKLGQNYPNPFNPTTNISFSVPEESNVELSIFDISGRLVQNIINNVKYVQGVYSVKFDGSNLPSGMYYYRLKTKDYIETRKMVLMK